MIRLFKLAVSLVVLLVLLVVADRLAARVSGQVVADRIRDSQHLSSTPTVRVEGFPFLTQLFRGTYDEVDASEQDIDTDGVRATALTLHLHGVHVKLSDLVSQSVKAVPVDHAEGTVDLSYADINAMIKPSGVTVAAASGGRVKVSGSVTVLGNTVKASGLGSLAAEPAGIKVTVTDPTASGLSSAVTSLLVKKLSFVLPTKNLPYGVSVDSVHAGDTLVEVGASIGAFTIQVQ